VYIAPGAATAPMTRSTRVSGRGKYFGEGGSAVMKRLRRREGTVSPSRERRSFGEP